MLISTILLAAAIERFGRFLKYLAGKASIVLSGIMGTIVNYFFRVAAKVVEFLARHLYLALSTIVALVVGYVGKTKRS